MQTIKLQVDGMSCNHCVSIINKALSQLEGVQSVSVNLEEKQVVVNISSPLTTEQSIIETITEEGYRVIK